MIGGLCRAVIVVEAAVTGGASITATKAVKYGITVFAVPGDVDRETSVWCRAHSGARGRNLRRSAGQASTSSGVPDRRRVRVLI